MAEEQVSFAQEAEAVCTRFLTLRNFSLPRPNAIIEVLVLIFRLIVHDDRPPFAFLAEQLRPFLSDGGQLLRKAEEHGYKPGDISAPIRRPDIRELFRIHLATILLPDEVCRIFPPVRFDLRSSDPNDWHPRTAAWYFAIRRSTAVVQTQSVKDRRVTLMEQCLLVWRHVYLAALAMRWDKAELVIRILFHSLTAASSLYLPPYGPFPAPPKSRSMVAVLHRHSDAGGAMTCLHPSDEVAKISGAEYVANYFFKEPHLEQYTPVFCLVNLDAIPRTKIGDLLRAVATRGVTSDGDIYRAGDDPQPGEPNASDLLWLVKRYVRPYAAALGDIGSVLAECIWILLHDVGSVPGETLSECIKLSESRGIYWTNYDAVRIRLCDVQRTFQLVQLGRALVTIKKLYDEYELQRAQMHDQLYDLLHLAIICVQFCKAAANIQSDMLLGCAMDKFWGRAYARARQTESWFRGRSRDRLVWQPLRIRGQADTLTTLDLNCCTRCGVETTLRCCQCGAHYCSKLCLERDWSVHENSPMHVWSIHEYTPDRFAIAAGVLTDNDFRLKWAKRFE